MLIYACPTTFEYRALVQRYCGCSLSKSEIIIRRYEAEYVVILAGDHVYKMDYSRMLIDHVEKGAECTVVCIPVPINEANEFGVMEVDEDYQITAFFEKTANPPSMPGRPDMALASMGIYQFLIPIIYSSY